VRDADELHDALLTLIWMPQQYAPAWSHFLPSLIETGRAIVIEREGWAAVERLAVVRAVFPNAEYPAIKSGGLEPVPEREDAMVAIVQGWMESTGPTTADELAERLRLKAEDVEAALLRLEAQGQVLRGTFRPTSPNTNSSLSPLAVCTLPPQAAVSSTDPLVRRDALSPDDAPLPGRLVPASVEWCDRRLLARIHRLTIGRLRKEVEPVTAADFMRFLFTWQHVTPSAQLHGEPGLLEIIRQLAGFEGAASAWERHLLPLRLSKYDPELLDRLCLNGSVMWGRITPHPRLSVPVGKGPVQGEKSLFPQAQGGRVQYGLGWAGENRQSPDQASDHFRKVVPTSTAPISLFPREDAEWLLAVFGDEERGIPDPSPALSSVAQDLMRHLQKRGACFFADLTRCTGHLLAEVENGLWELAAAGLVTADGFDSLRALLDPRRRHPQGGERPRRPRHGAGRWSLLRQEDPAASREGSCHEQVARLMLYRYGVVFRDLLSRESLNPGWRDLLIQYRRMELRGEVRGGRFVNGFTGEQFALPEAVEALRAMRRAGAESSTPHEIRVSAADPLNLVGVILPGPRVPALATSYVVYKNGMFLRSGTYRASMPSDPVSPQLKQAEQSESAVQAPDTA
jgi:ATP-dependent Lhr-like helicase